MEELAASAHDQGMSAHTMQATLRLLIVGQAPIEPWKLVGEPPRGVSRATSLRSLTSMRLTPCPVTLPRSWLASAAAGVTIGELEVRDTGPCAAFTVAAMACWWEKCTLESIASRSMQEEEHPRRGLTFMLSRLDDEADPRPSWC